MNDIKKEPIILRGLIVLEKVVLAQRPLTATELTEDIGLPRPTVNRILQQLESEGLVKREPIYRRYVPGPRSRKLALGIMSNTALGAPRRAILKTLFEEIGETCNCAILDGDHTIYIDRVEANWPFRIQLPVGSKLPLHCTASGKLYLAYMNARQRRRLIKSTPLKRFTDCTITDPKLLANELKRTKKEGIGIDNEELMTGMVAIAVPVLNLENEICFTVAVHGPKVRHTLEEMLKYIPSLHQAAEAMRDTYCSGQNNDA